MQRLLTRSARVALARRGAATRSYDALVIGGGPVGTEMARLCGLIGLNVAVVDPRGALLAAPTGYVSKVLLDVSHAVERGEVDADGAWTRAEAALGDTAGRALAMTADLFRGSSVCEGVDDFAPDVVTGWASFAGRDRNDGSYEIDVAADDGASERLSAPTVFVATGSSSTRLPSLPWDDAAGWLFDSDSIVGVGRVPKKILIQGGGLIAVEYAFIFRRLGSDVTVALREANVLEGKAVDVDVAAAVGARLESRGVDVRYGDGDIASATPPATKGGEGTVTLASSGATIACDVVLSALGRGGGAGKLRHSVEAAGLAPTAPSGHLVVDPATLNVKNGPTDAWTGSRVFAAGDVAGANAVAPGGLLSTGLAMGHVAVRGAFPAAWRKTFPEVGKRKGGQAFDALPAIAFWIDDGVATCGLTQQQAEAAYGDDAACASAKFSETVKACVQPRPDDEFLKVVFRKSSGAIVGVHIFGKDASEMINHGASFVNRGGTVWDVLHSIPPAVTYDECFLRAVRKACYSFAAFDKK